MNPPMTLFKHILFPGDMNPRFKGENILNLELDMPERTTYDYEGPGTDSRVQVGVYVADGICCWVRRCRVWPRCQATDPEGKVPSRLETS